VVEADSEGVEKAVQQAIDEGMDPGVVLKQGLISAMDVVGERYESGDMFLPEMLSAAMAMKAGVNLLKARLVSSGAEPSGVVVIGTVQGDIHDIGKNLVSMMLAGGGFDVTDLGTDVEPERFVQAVKEKKPHIVGLSALLNTTMPAIRTTIDALVEAGLRSGVKVMVGGAPITQAFADEVGADAYAPDAASTVAKARVLVNK
jgi:corrinoid protein of di/trimethylamine methyltransferase